MNLKDFHAPINTITIDRSKLEKKSGKNIYETICILDRVSQKLNKNLKEDLDKKLEEFYVLSKNNLEEIIENKEQIDLSKFYEKLPKSTSIAIQYLLDGKLKIR
ncbi:hypothetical protein [Blattabacterium cuenoti]|uniref:hypothetical protein n=1 Tax=Blattabacterium cuenoti TaxID=1653831 RepID=UPI00163B9FB4|nr:hypothetical protein [Blattabacterium cuenoti]